MSPAPPAPAAPEPLSVVGIGADGWDGLPAASQQALRTAEVLIGGPRQLALLPEECAGERVPWPAPLRPAVPGLLAAHAGRRVCVLASGDPMFYGIGRTLTEVLAEEPAAAPGEPRLRILPHPSSVSYACARLGWPLEDTEVITLVGRPTENLARALYDGHRLLVLSAGSGTPAEVAALLRAHGFGPTRMRVLEQLGGDRERTAEGTADGWDAPPADPLNVIALDCRRAPGTPPLSTVPGLPDAAYEHDGQLTKRHVRAATLAALAPAPGELLWDIGGGSGSIAIEWLRAHRSCRAVSVERDAVRAERIGRNAASLGVPALRIVHGRGARRAGGSADAGRGVHRRRADRPRSAGRVLGGAAGGRPDRREHRDAGVRGAARRPLPAVRRRTGPARGRPCGAGRRLHGLAAGDAGHPVVGREAADRLPVPDLPQETEQP